MSAKMSKSAASTLLAHSPFSQCRAKEMSSFIEQQKKNHLLYPLGSEQNVQQSDICSPMWSLGVKVVAMRGKPEKADKLWCKHS
jgi:hypothetical protein